MCGVWGFRGIKPDPHLLWKAAEGASRRGPHGVGWAWTDGPPYLQIMRAPGSIGPQRANIAALTASFIVGHARLATMGDWTSVDELQPAVSITEGPDRPLPHAIAHNGVIRNPDYLWPDAPTDSWALAHAYAAVRETRSPLDALDVLMKDADQVSWAVLVLDGTGLLVAHRNRHPLWVLDTDYGSYASSARFHPGCRALPEGQAVLV